MNHKTILTNTFNMTISELAKTMYEYSNTKTKTPLFLINNKYYAVTKNMPEELGLTWHLFENQKHGSPSKLIWESEPIN